MSDSQGTVGALDATSGKRISNAVVMLPAGTVLTNADGTTTTLSVDTPVFLQRVVIGDPLTLQGAEVRGSRLQVQDRALDVLERIAETMEAILLKISNL